MIDKLRKILHDGEGLAAEFKRCENRISETVYETVAAFSNRYGGHILLGVEDDGKVSGVNREAIRQLKKDFANTVNNSQKINPTLFLSLDEAIIDGKTILWCYVPPSSQVVLLNGAKIFDRVEDGDMEITRNTTMVAHIYNRKSSEYLERKIFPYAKESSFDFDRLMPIVRQLATHKQFDHPWAKMTDMEIIKSAGLYEESTQTGESGYNLAAILLFGRDNVIQSCTANYVTDAICRRENLDRYDDRLMVTTNLIDAYDQLVAFIGKHANDKFFIIDGQSVSVRSIIARELVSNVLVHRDFGSAFPAKIIIERDRIVTENWNLPKTPGRIDPNNFSPFPKNPILARFFINIGRADVLGSGVRNLYEYTKIYSGGEPELIDGDVFKTIVPLALSFNGVNDKMNDKGDLNDKMNDNVNDNVNDNGDLNDNVNDNVNDNGDLNDNVNDKEDCRRILSFVSTNGMISTAQAATVIGRSHSTARRVLLQLVDGNILIPSGSNRNKIYRLKSE